MLPESLTRLLVQHRASYAPHYPPSDNSDHGPMTYLAMHGLGMDMGDIERFANHYQPKLVPFSPSTTTVDAEGWQRHLGQRQSYAALLQFFDSEIAAGGWRAIVARYLPTMFSGWVKDAFHPIIRLGYGIEFEAPSEIAAGLAYLAITGDDPKLEGIARRPSTDSQGVSYLEFLQAARNPAFSCGPFNARYAKILERADLRPAMRSRNAALKELSRACLDVFHSTHDFFALHLVTCSHAFRVCAPWAGSNADCLFSVGIGAAYLAIGAPEFSPVAPSAHTMLPEKLAAAVDEHDIKLAYSCSAQSCAFGDPDYDRVAASYLEPRL